MVTSSGYTGSGHHWFWYTDHHIIYIRIVGSIKYVLYRVQWVVGSAIRAGYMVVSVLGSR